jgi:hypothetical protein
MKHPFTLFIILFFGNVFAQSFSGPESCEYDYVHQRWLIGNKNNGTVLIREANGNLSTFCSGMTQGPYGIEILGDKLYCCYGGGKIRGFDLATGQQVMDVNLGATFLNGITSNGDSTLYITDFTGKKIYNLHVGSLQFGVLTSGLTKSPNGIIYDDAGQRCIFVNWGNNAPVMQLDLTDSTVSVITNTSLGNCDGITKDGNGNYFIAAWSTQSVHKYNSNFSGNNTVVASNLSNPADIFYNITDDTLGIPNSGTANNLVLIGFNSTVGISVEEKNTSIIVYPNPANAFILMNDDFVEMELYAMDGKKIGSFENSNNPIDIRFLKPGRYIIYVTDKKGKIYSDIFIKTEL